MAVVRESAVRLMAGAALALAVSVAAVADDRPVIVVSRNALAPPTIEVHAGEVIRWRAEGGEHLHLSLDSHPGAHEAVVRAGEIRAVFLLPGVHTYKVLVGTEGQKALDGTVIVRETDTGRDVPTVCAPSFKEVCFEP